MYLNLFKAKELDGYLKSRAGIKISETSSMEKGAFESKKAEATTLEVIPCRQC